jgi:hypothetical protein
LLGTRRATTALRRYTLYAIFREMHIRNLIFIVTVLIFLNSCCREERYNFSTDEQLFLLDFEEGDSFSLSSNHQDTVTFDIIRKGSGFLSELCEACLCRDEFEFQYLDFSPPGNNYVIKNANELKFEIYIQLDTLDVYYEIIGTPSDYIVKRDFLDTLENAEVRILDDYVFNNNIIPKVVSILEMDASNNEISNLIFNNEWGIIEYSNAEYNIIYRKIF